MKKEKRLKVSYLIILLIALSIMIGVVGARSKYVTSAEGSDTAYVAKWDLRTNLSGTQTIDLFAHTTANMNYREAYGNEGEEQYTYIVAPGTEGKFTLEITNSGDVDAIINSIAIEKLSESSNVPLKFSVGNTYSASNATQDLTTLATNIQHAFSTNGTATIAHDSTAKSVSVCWKWDYYASDSEDISDTNLGQSSKSAAQNTGERAKYSLKITINAIQAQPQN